MIAASSPSLLRSSHFRGQRIAVDTTSSPAPASVRFRPSSITAVYISAESTRDNKHLCNPTMASSASLYDVLGIPMGATCQEIKAAYRRLARVFHPDMVEIDRKDTSTDEFMKIHAAYSTLSDPEKRADYDRSLFRRQRPFRSPCATTASTPASASRSGSSGYARRTWETDQCW